MAGSLLVLGATGQIGRNILRRTEDRSVLALARRPAEIAPAPNRTAQALELLDDVGVNCPDQAITTLPIWLLPPLIARLSERGVRRLVCFGTTSIHGKAESRNRHEREILSRLEKAENELPGLAAGAGVALTILQPTLIYGEGQDKTVTAAAHFIQRFGFYPVYAAAAGARQPVHADDLAVGALKALAKDETAGRSYALGGGETLTYRGMIARIFAVMQKPVRIVSVPALPMLLGLAGAVLPGSELTADVARRMNADLDFDDGAAARDFGYTPRAFLSGGVHDLFGDKPQS